MTFDDALNSLMTKSYYSLNNFAISMKDAEEIILDLRDAYKNWRLEK